MVTEISLRHQREVFSPHPDDPYLSVEIDAYYLTNQIRNQVARKFNPGRRMKYTYAYKTSAGGTAEEFIAELIKRQKLEIAYREKAEARLNEMLKGDTAKAYDFFLKANAQLQSMGIYPLPLPDSLRSYQNTLDFDE